MNEHDSFRLFDLPQVDRDKAVFWACALLFVVFYPWLI